MKKISLLFVVALMFSTLSYGQKYGYLDADLVLSQMPEMAQADSLLQRYVNQLENQVQNMSAEYQQKVADYQQNEATMSPLVKQTQQKQITDLETNIKNFQLQAQQDIQKQRSALYQPVFTKFRNAVNEVAKKNGYKFIVDNSKGVLLYYEEADNVAPLVKAKLGIK